MRHTSKHTHIHRHTDTEKSLTRKVAAATGRPYQRADDNLDSHASIAAFKDKRPAGRKISHATRRASPNSLHARAMLAASSLCLNGKPGGHCAIWPAALPLMHQTTTTQCARASNLPRAMCADWITCRYARARAYADFIARN